MVGPAGNRRSSWVWPVVADMSKLFPTLCVAEARWFQTFPNIPHHTYVVFPKSGRNIYPALSAPPLKLSLLLRVTPPPPRVGRWLAPGLVVVATGLWYYISVIHVELSWETADGSYRESTHSLSVVWPAWLPRPLLPL